MFASVALFVAVLLVLLFLFQTNVSKNFPSGPRPIPMLGNVLQLNLMNPIADLERLAKQYGNVYSLFIGPRPTVVINGLHALKEALVNKAAAFSGRPENLMINHAFQEKAPGMAMAGFNSSWKEHRRFGVMTMRNLGLGKQSMEVKILTEIRRIITHLEQSVGKDIDPHLLFHNAMSSIMCQVLFAKQFDYDSEQIKFFTEYFHETSKQFNGFWGMIYDFFPMLRSLPLPFQKTFKLFRAARGIYLEMLADCKWTRDPGKPKHFMDCYLDEMEKRGDNDVSFYEDQMCAVITEFHYGGTDTTANTLLTAWLYLMNYPHIQEKCQLEIDTVLDGKDEASFEDRNQMPYVQAVIHEIQRICSVAPLSLYHRTTQDTELMGFTIPRGTIIIPNLSSVLFEEGQWKYPREFNPENFLNEEGEFVRPEAFVPFSIGPRMCPGEALARMELFLVLVSLLRKFKFIWPEDAGEPDFTSIFGLTQSPKPYYMKVQLRGTD
ncbi:cytochrome P450 2F5-like isoform X1 [Betta splendens]|uniref:Cytochrome P450 2F5-like isoform X1 n=1 Tax=Betta splendens TaxID=158456 RepID=A0A6P7MQ08_BETSP|nr:cytochrome P450 2F5-like isoform X1 [Betta splendens]